MGLGDAIASVFGAGSVASSPATAAARTAAGVTPRPRRTPRGRAGSHIVAGFIDSLDHNAELRGDRWYGSPGVVGISQRMMRDAHVRRSVDGYLDVLCEATWDLRPASEQPIDREIAAFVRWALIECTPWIQIIRRIGRGYFSNGFHLEEPTDDNRPIPGRFERHPGGGIGVVPTWLHDRPAWTVRRWFQSRSNPAQLRAIEQYGLGSDVEPAGYTVVPANRLIRWTWDQEGANFEGVAPLRPAYGPWRIKTELLRYDTIKHERTGVGIPFIELAEGADDEELDAAIEIAAEFRVGERQSFAGTSGTKFSWVGQGEASSSDLDRAIGRCNVDIAINVAAGFTLLGLTNKGSGSYALGTTQQGQYHLANAAHARFVADAFNRGPDGWGLIERIVRLNYGAAVEIPRLEARNLPTRDWLSRNRELAKLAAAGLVTGDAPLEEQIRRSMDLDPHDPDTARARPVSLGTPPAGTDDAGDDQDDQTTGEGSA